MIVRQGAKYVVKSEDGSRHFGTYDSEEEARKRLAEVEAFKAMAAEGRKRHPPRGAR